MAWFAYNLCLMIPGKRQAYNMSQVFSPESKKFKQVCIPPGHVAVLPGYTLERATCGAFPAALHQVVSSCPETAIGFVHLPQCTQAATRICPHATMSTHSNWVLHTYHDAHRQQWSCVHPPGCTYINKRYAVNASRCSLPPLATCLVRLWSGSIPQNSMLAHVRSVQNVHVACDRCWLVLLRG